jgi:IS5 family transposase
VAGRYADAKQFKRHNRELRFLRTRLGRLIRDIRRKNDGDERLQEIFAIPLPPHSSATSSKIKEVDKCDESVSC